MAKVKEKNKNRMLFAFGAMALLMALLIVRVAWIQIVNGEEYTDIAIDQQTSDIPIEAKRGSIFDRNGEELASSATCYTLWVRPAQFTSQYKGGKAAEEAQKLAVILDTDAGELEEKMTDTENVLVRLVDGLEKETADKIKELEITGTEISEGTERFYPNENFASVLLGSVNAEGTGRSGIEQQYDEYLSGVAGRWVKNTDINGNTLSYGEKAYYQAENGLNVVLTVDEVLQHYMEDALRNGMEETGAKGAWGMAMDPETGEILAMSVLPGFDPNDATTPLLDDKEMEEFKKLSGEEQSAYLSQMWRNPLVSDVYEPGSTLKLVTASAMLEEGLATPNTTYNCAGSYVVSGVRLNCWGAAHGTQTLTEAVGNSCNPAHMQMALQMGKDTYYEYLDLFGLTTTTGIDLPAESGSIVQAKDAIGPVELATMGFGHGVAITPIQLISAISAIGNDGMLVRPHVVKELTDSEGNVVKTYGTEEIKQVISETTASEMCKIMELEVSKYGGSAAKIEGYSIGGKTGTAYKATGGEYSNETYSSFVCMSPMDDAKIAVLIVMDTPTKSIYGSATAAPVARNFLEKALPYMGINPQYEDGKSGSAGGGYSYVPDVTGMTFEKAEAALAEAGIDYEIVPAADKDEKDELKDQKVVDQYPKGGKKINKDSKVYLYRE